MQDNTLDSASDELLSIPPLIFRSVRRKLLKTALAIIDIDISPLHFEIMKLLKEAGTLHVAEIGERLQIAKAQMTHLIDKLVDLNMVDRDTDEADRRTINVTLTDKGRKFIELHKIKIVNAVREYISCLEDEELEELSRSLRILRDTLLKLQ